MTIYSLYFFFITLIILYILYIVSCFYYHYIFFTLIIYISSLLLLSLHILYSSSLLFLSLYNNVMPIFYSFVFWLKMVASRRNQLWQLSVLQLIETVNRQDFHIVTFLNASQRTQNQEQ